MQKKVEIDEKENAGSLHDKLMFQGGQLVLNSLEKIESGNYKLVKQSDLIRSNEKAPIAPKIFKDDRRINWQQKAEIISRFIRGLSPYPTPWTILKHKSSSNELILKIFKTKIKASPGGKAGHITANKETLEISCTEGSLEIIELQLEGKKRMQVKDLLNGFNINEYEIMLN